MRQATRLTSEKANGTQPAGGFCARRRLSGNSNSLLRVRQKDVGLSVSVLGRTECTQCEFPGRPARGCLTMDVMALIV